MQKVYRDNKRATVVFKTNAVVCCPSSSNDDDENNNDYDETLSNKIRIGRAQTVRPKMSALAQRIVDDKEEQQQKRQEDISDNTSGDVDDPDAFLENMSANLIGGGSLVLGDLLVNVDDNKPTSTSY